MDPTARFAELLRRPEAEVPLDEAATLIGAHADPRLDVPAVLGRLDELAAGVAAPTVDALADHLFGRLGFTGNRRAYYDPRNSYVHEVVARRTGIPITLAVVTMAVGDRAGVPLVGVGMPGHFLLRRADDPDAFLDPFDGGARLDRAGCRLAFAALHGADAPFDDGHLAPVGPRAIVARMLANLRAVFTAAGDRDGLVWALRLRTLVPGVPPEERAALAGALAALGRFGEAAAELDELGARVGGEVGSQYGRSAVQLRARMN